MKNNADFQAELTLIVTCRPVKNVLKNIEISFLTCKVHLWGLFCLKRHYALSALFHPYLLVMTDIMQVKPKIEFQFSCRKSRFFKRKSRQSFYYTYVDVADSPARPDLMAIPKYKFVVCIICFVSFPFLFIDLFSA